MAVKTSWHRYGTKLRHCHLSHVNVAWLGPLLTTINAMLLYRRTFGFVDAVMFSHNRPGKADAERGCLVHFLRLSVVW